MGLALGTNLRFYTSIAKGLKLKVRRFLGLIPTFVEVAGEKLVWGTFLPPPSPSSRIGLREIVFVNSVLKINSWTYKIKDLNVEKVIGSFYEKKLLKNALQMSYYLEPDSHFTEKVKVVLELSNYATKIELDHAKGVDTSNLAAKKILLLWKLKLLN